MEGDPGGSAPGRVQRVRAAKIWDSSRLRAGFARQKSHRGRRDAGGAQLGAALDAGRADRGYSPRRRGPAFVGPGPPRQGGRGGRRAAAGADVPRQTRAPAMNQLRGERRGAGVTGKRRGRAEG
jgi:hypothetical protein